MQKISFLTKTKKKDKMTMNSNILIGSPIDPNDVSPEEIIVALHKRICDAEKLIANFRTLVVEQSVSMEMMENKIKALTKEFEDFRSGK
jgi:uncharacterized coiled-coil protein SlyX